MEGTRKYKILIIEDDPLMSRMYERKFANENFEVSTAKDGEEALSKVKTNKPELILLDLMMPKMSGFQFLEETKKNEESKNIPVLIVTNLTDFEGKNQQRGLDLGAVDYIIKANTTIDDTVQRVKTILEKNA